MWTPLRRFIVTLGSWLIALAVSAGAASLAAHAAPVQPRGNQAALDARVKAFLSERAGTWRDLNVPASDGQLLHDLVVKHHYTRALEIGTSTGHSGIWIAWALSKTGGKLITVELDEGRHREALKNFEAAGLSSFIDARLGDAHEIVPALPGPFDFVFSDADKDWYPNYFRAVLPKLTDNACYTSHNVSESGRRGAFGAGEYLALLRSTPNTETTVDERGAGLAITCKAKR
jgi:caffeoyl-CoA O-methyltransferase